MTSNLLKSVSGISVYSDERRPRSRIVVPSLVLAIIVLSSIFAPLIAPFDPNAMDLNSVSMPPSLENGHLLGTDSLGRDVLSRTIWGGIPPILIATLSVSLGLLVGACLGIISGLKGGVLDQLVGRIADIQLSIPGLVLALVFLAIFGTSPVNVVVIIAVESWPLYFRVTRSQVLSIKETGYIEASALAGVSSFKKIIRHVLPNIFPILLVTITVNFTAAVLLESALSFLGVGIQPPTADWGVMIAEGQGQLATSWWASVVPGIFLVLLLLSFQIIADEISAAFSLKDIRNGVIR